MKFINGNIYKENFKFNRENMYVNNGVFENESQSVNDEIIDLHGGYVIPGLIDIHNHGNMGHDFSDGSETGLATIANYLARNGITSFAPASMTLPEEVLKKAFINAACFKEKDEPGLAVLRGINMEGPFFSEKKKGAQNGAYLRLPDFEMFIRLNEAANGLIRFVDIAPELPGAIDFISKAKDICIVSIAHTDTNYETARKAFDIGASHVTHLFNGMPPLLHRDPGVIGAAAESEHVFAELICDGVHVHPSAIRAAFSLFGVERIVMISDALPCCGMPQGEHSLGGQKICIDGTIARLDNGTIAGSANNLFGIMKIAISFGIRAEDAIRSATINPARAIGVDEEVGSISIGKRADFLICDPKLNLQQVYIAGKPVKIT